MFSKKTIEFFKFAQLFFSTFYHVREVTLSRDLISYGAQRKTIEYIFTEYIMILTASTPFSQKNIYLNFFRCYLMFVFEDVQHFPDNDRSKCLHMEV